MADALSDPGRLSQSCRSFAAMIREGLMPENSYTVAAKFEAAADQIDQLNEKLAAVSTHPDAGSFW